MCKGAETSNNTGSLPGFNDENLCSCEFSERTDGHSCLMSENELNFEYHSSSDSEKSFGWVEFFNTIISDEVGWNVKSYERDTTPGRELSEFDSLLGGSETLKKMKKEPFSPNATVTSKESKYDDSDDSTDDSEHSEQLPEDNSNNTPESDLESSSSSSTDSETENINHDFKNISKDEKVKVTDVPNLETKLENSSIMKADTFPSNEEVKGSKMAISESEDSENDSTDDSASSEHSVNMTSRKKSENEESQNDNSESRNAALDVTCDGESDKITELQNDLESRSEDVQSSRHELSRKVATLNLEEFNLVKVEDDTNVEEEDEIWMVQCPVTLHPQNLKNSELDFGGKSSLSLHLENESPHNYETMAYLNRKKPISCLLPRRTKQCFEAKVLHPTGVMVITEKLDASKLDPFVVPKSRKLEIPEGLRVRHPLFGRDFESELQLRRERTNQLSASKEDKKKKKKSKSKGEVDKLEEVISPKKGKKRKAEQYDEFDSVKSKKKRKFNEDSPQNTTNLSETKRIKKEKNVSYDTNLRDCNDTEKLVKTEQSYQSENFNRKISSEKIKQTPKSKSKPDSFCENNELFDNVYDFETKKKDKKKKSEHESKHFSSTNDGNIVSGDSIHDGNDYVSKKHKKKKHKHSEFHEVV